MNAGYPWLNARVVGFTLLALVLIGCMVVLGLWQLGVYDDHQRDDVRERASGAPIPLDDLIGPDDPFPVDGQGERVQATGAYRADEQMYAESLGGSRLDYAVVTPLVVDDSAVLVVRGRSDALGPAPPAGPVVVEGVLEPSSAAGSPLDERRVSDGMRIPALLDGFDEDLYSGYVVLTESRPAEQLEPVQADLPEPSRWAGFRNLVYAIQWWVFAAFVVFMWWRIVNEPEPSRHEAVR